MTAATLKLITLHEQVIPGRRLGRHVEHDPRSFGFPAPMSATVSSVRHKRRVPIFDQGQLGSCTGNAAVGCISTDPFKHDGTETEAVSVYDQATTLDNIPGTHPPTDTGSTGLAVMKALKLRGFVKGYTHAFGLQHVLQALVLRPGITGISWRTGCDAPDAQGVVRYTGTVRGGHEIVLVGIDADKQLVWFANSWGTGWGLQGYFAMSFADYGAALADHGDATFPTV